MARFRKNIVQRFMGLRLKFLLPILFGGILILFVSIYCIRYAIFNSISAVIDVKLVTNLAQITNNGITIDIHYLKHFPGVYDSIKLNIKSEDIFKFDWVSSKEKVERQRQGGFFLGGYIYSPEKDAYVLLDSFKGNPKLPKVLDHSTKGWHTGTKFLDGIDELGTVRFQTKKWNNLYDWLAVSNKDKSKILLIGTNGQFVNGIMNYASLLQGSLLLCIFLFVFLITWAVISRTINRIKKIDNHLDYVTKDSLPDEQLFIKSKDEIEDMADVINRMVAGLRDKQRIESELNFAASIQLGMLPKNFTAFSNFSNHNRFDLYATMKPAKEVGGDFYDFFMPDENHLAFVVADVSGKGVPAALFMVMGKTLLRSSIRGDREMQDTMSEVNKILCENNENRLFITVWAGLLNLVTRELTFCNAGHNPPLLMKGDKEFEYLNDVHGTVMGFLKKAKYKQGKIKLSPGDKIYLYTDGVTEAQNEAEVLYDDNRLMNCLNAHKELSPKEMLAVVKENVDAFVGGAEQFDDMTMLMVEYLG